MTLLFILMLAVLVAIISLLCVSLLMFPDDEQDEHATMHLWAPRCCPPCDGKCKQGRDCPANQ